MKKILVAIFMLMNVSGKMCASERNISARESMIDAKADTSRKAAKKKKSFEWTKY